MVARPTWFYRHAVATVLACSVLGTSIGIVVAASLLPEGFGLNASTVLVPIGFLATAGGSALIGLLVGILLVRAGTSGLECPRCGTLNEEEARECSACGLSLA